MYWSCCDINIPHTVPNDATVCVLPLINIINTDIDPVNDTGSIFDYK